MAYIPAPQTVMAELRFLWSTQKVENVLYFQASGGLTTALMTTLGNNLIGWWNTNFKPISSNILNLNEVFLTDLTTQTSPTVSVVTGLPSPGTDAAESMPFNVSLCFSFRTAGRGRTSRGRNYVPGLTEGKVNGNGILSSYFTPATAAYTTLIGAGTFTPGLQWCVVSRHFNGVPRTSALVQPITSVVLVDQIIDSQRRRLPGRGK
jgi:hypothetical protein